MAKDPKILKLINSPRDWYSFITENGVTAEDAIATYERCWETNYKQMVDLHMVPLLWSYFEDGGWRSFLTEQIVRSLDKTVIGADTFEIVELVHQYYPVMKKCEQYLDRTLENNTLDSGSVRFVSQIQAIIKGIPPSSTAEHWFRLGVPHVLSAQQIADSLLVNDGWEHLLALPPRPLNVLFERLAEHPHFAEGSENDLRLRFTLCDFQSERMITESYLRPVLKHDPHQEALRKLETVIELAKENRYWRALVFNFFSNDFYGRWPSSVEDMLEDYREEVLDIISNEGPERTLLLMEYANDYGNYTPTWMAHLLARTDTRKFETTNSVWAHLVPTWAEHESSWQALGLDRREMVQSCLQLIGTPEFSSTPALPDNISIT